MNEEELRRFVRAQNEAAKGAWRHGEVVTIRISGHIEGTYEGESGLARHVRVKITSGGGDSRPGMTYDMPTKAVQRRESSPVAEPKQG
jgi:hypothetical protein